MLSALVEIDWVQRHVTAPPTNQNTFQHYYLGYYIHSCPKMRYKAQYRPSEMLCAETHQWVAFDQALPILDKTPVAQARLAPDTVPSSRASEAQVENALDELMLQISSHVIFMEVRTLVDVARADVYFRNCGPRVKRRCGQC